MIQEVIGESQKVGHRAPTGELCRTPLQSREGDLAVAIDQVKETEEFLTSLHSNVWMKWKSLPCLYFSHGTNIFTDTHLHRPLFLLASAGHGKKLFCIRRYTRETYN